MGLDFKIEPPKDEWSGARDALTNRFRLVVVVVSAGIVIFIVGAIWMARAR